MAKALPQFISRCVLASSLRWIATSKANKDAKTQYKEQVRNAKINRKADKAAATAELNAAEPRTPKDTGLQH